MKYASSMHLSLIHCNIIIFVSRIGEPITLLFLIIRTITTAERVKELKYQESELKYQATKIHFIILFCSTDSWKHFHD